MFLKKWPKIVKTRDEERVSEPVHPYHYGSPDVSLESEPSPIRPRVLLAACGSTAAVKFGSLCHLLSEWAHVKAVASDSAMHFINRNSLPQNVNLYTDQFEWLTWRRSGDEVAHIELSRWAEILVIAPISANTLPKIAGGVCDNLLTCIVRAWNYAKPVFIAPSMNHDMWNNPFTERHLRATDELGMILIPPFPGTRAMEEPPRIYSTVRQYYDQHM